MATIHHHERTPRRPRTTTAATTPVSNIMSRDVITVRSGTSLDTAVELMLSRGLSRVPIVDEQYRPIGIISKTDVVQDAHDREDTTEEPVARSRRRVSGAEGVRGYHMHPEGTSVDDVMSRSLVTVEDSTTINRVAELMVTRHIHGVPVVSAMGDLVGFVSTMDVLGWLAGLR